MSGEQYNSPNEQPKNFRGLKASEILNYIATINSLVALESMRTNILERTLKRELDEDEKDILVSVEFHIQKLKDSEGKDIKRIEEETRAMTLEEKHANFALRALEARFNDDTFDIQLGVDEEARIALFKQSSGDDS